MISGDRRDHADHDHPQTIKGEPLDQTRSGELLEEQEEAGGAVPLDDEDEEDDAGGQVTGVVMMGVVMEGAFCAVTDAVFRARDPLLQG